MRVLSILILLIFIHNISRAQSPAQKVAAAIAKKMQDSLDLTDSQSESIYSINMNLSNRKYEARQQISNRDSLTRKFQKIENSRDSLYLPVLGNEKYLLYKQKKIRLINAQ